MGNPYEHPPSSSRAADSSTEDEGHTSNWCDLPKEVLHGIALHLNHHIHLNRLRGVCSAWRSSLHLSDIPTGPTTLAISIPPFEPNLPGLALFLTQYCLLSPPLPSATTNQDGCSPLDGRWLARTGALGHNRWHLFNPLKIDEYFYPSPYVSASINLLHCHITELALVFTLVLDTDCNLMRPIPIAEKMVGGLILDTTPHFAVLAKLKSEFGGLFMLSFDGLSEPQWIHIRGASNLRILDITFYKNKFYAFDLSGWQVVLIDHANPLAPMEFIRGPDILGDRMDDLYTVTFDGRFYFFRGVYLVPGNDSLYQVVEVEEQSDPDKVNLIVFVLKEEQGNNSWLHVNSLGDQIFFIGYDVSFSLPCSSINLPQWKPNSICLFWRPTPVLYDRYTEGAELLKSITYADYWRYFRLFEMGEEDKGVVPFEMLPKRLYTGLFFPPPYWVKWRCPSRLDDVEFTLDGLKFLDEDYLFFSD